MSRLRRYLFALSLPVLTFWVSPADGQETTRVEHIRANPSAHVNETRQIEGTVDRFVDVGTATTRAYYLEDDFGHQIRVLTTSNPPGRGERVRVAGVVSIDAGGNPFLQGQELTILGNADPDPDPFIPPPAIEGGNQPGVDPTLLAFGAGFLVLVGIMIFLLVRGRQEAEPIMASASIGSSSAAHPAPTPTSSPTASSDSAFDGKTVKFTAPPPGTMKLLPGRLEIIGGEDKGREIRFLNQGGGVPQVTFGRSSGPAYKHIQLKAVTVSREHARMTLAGKTWNIENLSSTNPVRVNGQEIPSGGQPLSGADEIDMGEVKFRFHAGG